MSTKTGQGFEGARMARYRIVGLQIFVAAVLFGGWHLLTAIPAPRKPLLDPFFFSTPLEVAGRTWTDLAGGRIWFHLGVTALETLLAFAAGALGGLVIG